MLRVDPAQRCLGQIATNLEERIAGYYSRCFSLRE
jgi:hypothetical protein